MRRSLPLILLALAACHRGPPPAATPDDAYRNYVRAVAGAHESGEAKGLLEYFDAPTRAALKARAQAASEATRKDLPVDPGYQLLSGSAGAPAVTGIQVQDLTASSATLQVATDGGPTQAVKMVQEGGRWRIHLDALPGA